MAGENTPPPVVQGNFSGMKHTSSARVDKVIDAQTVLMKDGKIVRLSGIDYPVQTGEDAPEPLIEGKRELERLLPPGTEIMIYQTRNIRAGRVNRMGHMLAHLATKREGGGSWINGTLIARGHAWVQTDRNNPDMADQLYTLEQKARADKLGLWATDSPYGLLTPETAAKGEGAFRVVEGTVNRAAVSKNNLYLNFGPDWRTDFSVMMSPDIRKSLARTGIDPMGLSGRTIRVRGWIRHWNGPFMELETLERLEIPAPSAPLDPKVDGGF